eukprot:gnl/MRDRNA2_/MRDRNA2_70247_c0_seq3.p1 gnl/MRDRNA2_/MRDRNA2_70247_c0~~gnl/MRDRNA2_/MRDRNA2_70247_c0_seq3.p1  ORF type:complete len:433 (+),score=58.36 gnl/MRDRNA2_/MRDRNA2_70247_c0_seq3:68-1300(+)
MSPLTFSLRVQGFANLLSLVAWTATFGTMLQNKSDCSDGLSTVSFVYHVVWLVTTHGYLFSSTREALIQDRLRYLQHVKWIVEGLVEKELIINEKLTAAKATVKDIGHPMVLLGLTDFEAITIKELRTCHEGMRDHGKLKVLDTVAEIQEFKNLGNKIIFYSYQWLSWNILGPDETQHHCMVTGPKKLCERNQWQQSKTYVWLDIVSIPQSNASVKLLAIYSLYTYAKHADSMLIIAPTSRHANTGEIADEKSYKSRVWTRAEQFAHFCQHGMKDIYVMSSINDIQQIDEKWLKSVIHVFEGQMTCCRLDHNSGSSRCDKESLVMPMVGLYSEICSKKCRSTLSQVERDALVHIEADKDRMFPAKFEYSTSTDKSETRTLFGDLIDRLDSERLAKERKRKTWRQNVMETE